MKESPLEILQQVMREFQPNVVGFSMRNCDTNGCNNNVVEHNAALVALAKQYVRL